MLEVCAMVKYVKACFAYLQVKKSEREVHMKMCFLQVKLYIKMKMQSNKFRGLDSKYRERIRHNMILAYRGRTMAFQRRAKWLVWSALNSAKMHGDWILLKDKLDGLVIYMQKRFKNRFLFKHTKIEMLEMYWNKQLDEIE